MVMMLPMVSGMVTSRLMVDEDSACGAEHEDTPFWWVVIGLLFTFGMCGWMGFFMYFFYDVISQVSSVGSVVDIGPIAYHLCLVTLLLTMLKYFGCAMTLYLS